MPVERLILADLESRGNSLLRKACDIMEVDVICVDRYSLNGMPKDCPIGGTALSGGWTFCRSVAHSLGGYVLEPADNEAIRMGEWLLEDSSVILPRA